MGRFLLTIAAGTLGVLGVAWYFGLSVPNDGNAPTTPPVVQELGGTLYTPADLKPLPSGAKYGEDIVIGDCYINALDKVEISSQKSGQLLFVGTEVPMPRWFSSWFAKYYRTHGGLGIATFNQGDYDAYVAYRRLHDGDTITEGQMIALVNPDLALNDVASKNAKLLATEADVEAAQFLEREAEARKSRFDQVRAINPKAVTVEEYSAAILTHAKYYLEMIAKKEAVKTGKIEVKQAEIVYRQHQILNKLPGTSTVKMIYKSAGEGIKDLEPVLQLQNAGRMRVEGKITIPDFNRLQRGGKVVLEPTIEMPPIKLIQVHNAEITSIAVCNENLTHKQFTKSQPRFVTASEGPRAVVWDSVSKAVLHYLQHKSPVRVVACSPAGAKENLCLTGCADGSIWLWNLDKLSAKATDEPKPILELPKQHSHGVTALAFSHDGKFFASADQNNTICLWSTEQQKVLYPFDPEHHVDDAHQDQITSLHFTPQCQLISASRDRTLRIWKLHANGATLVGDPLTNRTGHVSQLGVSKDGSKLLFDRGSTLQIWSVKEQRPVWEIHNPSATQFEPIALFSPDEDSALLLTSSGSEGRLQLWRAPTARQRGFEVCHLVPRERSMVTCAAFSPVAGSADGAFVVSGTKEGQLYYWRLPTQKEIDDHRIVKDENGHPITLSLLERAFEGNQVRVSVMVSNSGRLIPGQRVTLVIQPD